ncbi:hypothetical protein EDD11_004908 [Mortierella claussenii]|nr:hypothetical protein EDD11_004908 [Mortierella claussenii]
MLSSLHDKISKLVHHHREKRRQVEPIHVAEGNANPSKNWDFNIVFQGAKDVPVGDILSSDPYLEAHLGPPEDPSTLAYITGVQWRTLNPMWNATWTLLNVSDGTALELLVMDKDKMKEDTLLGKASLILDSSLEGTQEHVLDIVKPDGRTKGKLLIQTSATRSAGRSAALVSASTGGPARYSRHTSYAAGVLTRESKYEFYAYRIRLYHLLDIFGNDPHQHQHWNVKYEAAQRIFADTLEGLNIRNALHSQHSYLYRHGHTTIYGELATANDLGNLLHGERLKKQPEQDLKTVVFTYSIIPKGLYFSETGTAFFQDFMSKHAMHANRATEVLYSGEFRLFRDEQHQNDWTLLIDNNSGTYGPKKEDLPKIQKVFELNFPDLVVVALDREDPYLKEIRDETKKAEAEISVQQKQRFSLFSSMSSHSEDTALEA